MATKGSPFSVRFSETTDLFVEEQARRLKRSKSSIVEELTEEAAKARRFPGIAFRGDGPSREPWVIGTGLDVWEICEMLGDFGSIEALVADSHLTERQIRLALAYRDEYPEEIEAAIAENRRPLAELEKLYPIVEVVRARS
jgi:uncharacterized protein (DUF433 family)